MKNMEKTHIIRNTYTYNREYWSFYSRL